MSEEIKLTLEQQFSIARTESIIDSLSYEDLREFAKILNKEYVCRVAVTNNLLKVKWGIGGESK